MLLAKMLANQLKKMVDELVFAIKLHLWKEGKILDALIANEVIWLS